MTLQSLILLWPAALMGILHALEPGHGKTAIIGYLIGTRASAWESAIALGLSQALTHGIAIFVLALIVTSSLPMTGNSFEGFSVWLSRGAGSVIILIASYFLWKESRINREECCPVNIPLSVFQQKQDRWANVKMCFLMGMSGGILPCPTAVASYIGAVSDGEVERGLTSVLVFSIGLFLSVSFSTWLLVTTAGRWLRPQNSIWQNRIKYLRFTIMFAAGLYLIIFPEVSHE